MAQIFFDRMFGALLWRKVYHFVGGAFLLTALLVLEPTRFSLLLIFYFVAFRIVCKRISFAVLGMLLLFLLSGSKWTTMAAGLVLFVGDGAAAVIGARFGVTKWRFNPHKSLWGSASFLVTSFAALLLMLRLLVPLSPQVLIVAFMTALSGCIAEMLPITWIRDRKADDNLVVLIVSGLVFYGLCLLPGMNLLSAR